MKITIDNYEEWMVDFLDGTLSEEDQKLFEQFLDEHPNVMDEMEGLGELVLSPETTPSFDKSSLLKTEADQMDIPYADYIAIKELELGLDRVEQEWKKEQDKLNSKSKALFNDYKNTIIQTENNVIYPEKNALKRAVILPFVSISTFRKMSAAAAIAILLGIGTIPVLKQNGSQMQTVVVNDTPSLIEIPKKESKRADISTPIKEVSSKQKKENKGKILSEKQVPAKDIIVKDKEEDIKPLLSKGIDNRFYNKTLNAYEIGLNSMMPILIANNVKQTEKELMAMENHVSSESHKLSRSARVVNSGIKVLNYLSGNPTTIKKYLNENGEMVAYQLESDNISLSRKIKSMPVTN